MSRTRIKCPKCQTPVAWCKCGKSAESGELAAAPGSVKSLDGYRAAFIAVDNLLDAAEYKLPKRLGGREHLAAYREGYYNGLLLAHCHSALGEFPEHNATAIEMILSQNGKAQAQPDGRNKPSNT